MRHAEAEYISLGRLLEKAPNASRSRQAQWDIRWRIAQEETDDDKAQARQLVERGRQEARTGL